MHVSSFSKRKRGAPLPMLAVSPYGGDGDAWSG